MVLEEMHEILHKVILSQMCLSDEIHVAKACGEDISRRENKMKYWEGIEKILRNAIIEIEMLLKEEKWSQREET